MSGDQLREQGIAAAKAGRKDEARKLLSQAAELNPRDAQAWLFLASVTDNRKSRLLALRHVLEIERITRWPAGGRAWASLRPNAATSAPRRQTAPPPTAAADLTPHTPHLHRTRHGGNAPQRLSDAQSEAAAVSPPRNAEQDDLDSRSGKSGCAAAGPAHDDAGPPFSLPRDAHAPRAKRLPRRLKRRPPRPSGAARLIPTSPASRCLIRSLSNRPCRMSSF